MASSQYLFTGDRRTQDHFAEQRSARKQLLSTFIDPTADDFVKQFDEPGDLAVVTELLDDVRRRATKKRDELNESRSALYVDAVRRLWDGTVAHTFGGVDGVAERARAMVDRIYAPDLDAARPSFEVCPWAYYSDEWETDTEDYKLISVLPATADGDHCKDPSMMSIITVTVGWRLRGLGQEFMTVYILDSLNFLRRPFRFLGVGNPVALNHVCIVLMICGVHESYIEQSLKTVRFQVYDHLHPCRGTLDQFNRLVDG